MSRSRLAPLIDLVAIGERVRIARTVKGLSQAQLGVKCGLTRGGVAHIETAYSDMTVQTLGAVASALGVRPAFLLDGESAPLRTRRG